MSHILFKKRMRHGVSRGPFIQNADYLRPLVLAALSTYAYIHARIETKIQTPQCYVIITSFYRVILFLQR